MAQQTWLPCDTDPTFKGDVRVCKNVAGVGVAPRDLLVWLPPGCDHETCNFPVLYLHDGQNCFGDAPGRWAADHAAHHLWTQGWPCIVVAVAHGGSARIDEYGPFCDATVPESAGSKGGKAHLHLDYLVKVVKPLVDASFRTVPGAANTAVGGSSMGGLFSLYAALQRPSVFGCCLAFSSALWVGGEGTKQWLAQAKPQPTTRIYLDCGTHESEDHGFATRHLAQNVETAQVLQDAGAEVMFVKAQGAAHHESAWRERFPKALKWFLEAQGLDASANKLVDK